MSPESQSLADGHLVGPLSLDLAPDAAQLFQHEVGVLGRLVELADHLRQRLDQRIGLSRGRPGLAFRLISHTHIDLTHLDPFAVDVRHQLHTITSTIRGQANASSHPRINPKANASH